MQNLIGLILPPLVDVINSKVANSNIRFLISIAICLVVACLSNIDKIKAGDWNSLLANAGIIFTEAQVVYKLYWDKSKVRERMFGN